MPHRSRVFAWLLAASIALVAAAGVQTKPQQRCIAGLNATGAAVADAAASEVSRCVRAPRSHRPRP